MNNKISDSHYDALLIWAFEPPPIGVPGHAAPAARIGRPGAPPQIFIGEELVDVVGMTASGWLSTTGGWARYTGNRDAGLMIAEACTAVQSILVADHERFVAAIKRHRNLGDDTEIGGIRVLTRLNGHRVIRLADITVPEVRMAIDDAMDREELEFGATEEGEPRVSLAPVGFLDAELWWWFCRNASR